MYTKLILLISKQLSGLADLAPSENASYLQDTRMAVENMRHVQKIYGVSLETISEWIIQGRK